VLGKIGIDEGNLESFAFHLYQSCQRKDIMPEAIVECSQEILSLSKTEKIPISRILQYVEKMIVEKQDLEQELRILRSDQATAKKEREEALKNSQITNRNIDEFIGLKSMLTKSDLSLGSLSELHKLARVLGNVRDCSYEPGTITTKLSAIDNLQDRQMSYKKT
jgi:hypothetical protein